MRPQGEIRQAIRKAAEAAAATEAGAATWRELCQRANVGYDVGRRTVVNMANAGELQRKGTRPDPKARRPMTLYAPANWSTSVAGTTGLDAVMRGWHAR